MFFVGYAGWGRGEIGFWDLLTFFGFWKNEYLGGRPWSKSGFSIV